MSEISFYAENISRFKPQSTAQRGQISVHSQNIGYRPQLTKHSVFPMLDRPKPVFDFAKTWTPVVPRVKLLGVFGILDPDEEDYRSQRYGARSSGGQYSVERRIPRPYPASKFRWPPEKDIARIPAIGILGGAYPVDSRTLSPQKDVTRQTQSARVISVQV